MCPSTNIRSSQIKDEDITSDDIADAAVRGATGNAGTQREIATGTVSTPDLRDGAITNAKVDAAAAIAASKLAAAGATTQLQFNNGGTFGASGSLVWSGTTLMSPKLFLFDSVASTLLLSSSNNIGGGITLTTDHGSNILGGSLLMTTGNCVGGGVATGGNFTMTCGFSGAGTDTIGGNFTLTCGNSSNDALGGNLIITSGNAATNRLARGGSIILTSGTASFSSGVAQGGSITLTSGLPNAGASSLGGHITLSADVPANGGNLYLLGTASGRGQIGVGTGSPVSSASVDITSTTRGFLPPRMTTTQRNAISSPVAGLLLYNTSTSRLNIYTTSWGDLAFTETDPLSLHLNGDNSPTTNINWNQFQITNLVMHKGSSFPVSPVEGQLFYDTTTKQFYGRTDTAWVVLG